MDEQLHLYSLQRFVQARQSQLSLFASCFRIAGRLPFVEADAATGLHLIQSPTQTPSMQYCQSDRQKKNNAVLNSKLASIMARQTQSLGDSRNGRP